jgi:hypothetical protein
LAERALAIDPWQNRRHQPDDRRGALCEALELADEVRAAFDMSGRLDLIGEDEDLRASRCRARRCAPPRG